MDRWNAFWRRAIDGIGRGGGVASRVKADWDASSTMDGWALGSRCARRMTMKGD